LVNREVIKVRIFIKPLSTRIERRKRMLRKKSIKLFFRAVVVSFLAIFGLLILLPNIISAKEKKPVGAFPARQCIKLSDGRIFKTEKISMMVYNDSDGCIIIDEEKKPIKFYRSTDCSGEPEDPRIEPAEEGFVYKSGIDGGCPEAIEVKHGSPACVTLTLLSGRKVIFCY